MKNRLTYDWRWEGGRDIIRIAKWNINRSRISYVTYNSVGKKRICWYGLKNFHIKFYFG